MTSYWFPNRLPATILAGIASSVTVSLYAPSVAWADKAGAAESPAAPVTTGPPVSRATMPPVQADPSSPLAPITGQPALPTPEVPVPAADRPLTSSPRMAIVGPVSYSRAVSLALALNPRIARANAGLLSATGQVGEANALRLPTFGANAGNRTYEPGVNEYRNGKETKTDVHDLPTVGVTATLPIDIAGDLRAATDQAQFTEIAARLDVNRARNEVVTAVGDTFYGVLRAKTLVKVAQENLTDSLTRLDDATKKFRERTVAILDVVRAQTDVANARQQLIVARSNVALSLSALSDAIGIAVDTPVDVTDEGAVVVPAGVTPQTVDNTPPDAVTILSIAEAETKNLPGSLSAPAGNPPPGEIQDRTLIVPLSASANAPGPEDVSDPLKDDSEYAALAQEALGTRPEILEGDAQVAAARHGIAYARRSILPSVQVGLRYDYAPVTSGTSVVLNNTQTFVGLVFPLYDAGQARAREQEARARETDAVVARRQAVDGVTLDLRQSYLSLLQARDRVAVANQALTQAREAYAIALTRYNAGVTSRAGLSPLLEVSDAQAALVQAETLQVNALYDYNRTRVDLNHAIGRYSYTAVGPGFSAPPPAKTVGR